MLRQSCCQSSPVIPLCSLFRRMRVWSLPSVLQHVVALASYIHDGSVVMTSRRSQASQVVQIKSSIQIESRSSSGHDETASEVRKVRCQYRVLRNKTKQKQRRPSRNHQKRSRRTQQNQSQLKTREMTPKHSQTKKNHRRDQVHPTTPSIPHIKGSSLGAAIHRTA